MTERPPVVRASSPADDAALAALSPAERRAELAARRRTVVAVATPQGEDAAC